jgi:hypothetical protein
MGVTAGIFLASILLKEMRYLVYIYKISMVAQGFQNKPAGATRFTALQLPSANITGL